MAALSFALVSQFVANQQKLFARDNNCCNFGSKF